MFSLSRLWLLSTEMRYVSTINEVIEIALNQSEVTPCHKRTSLGVGLSHPLVNAIFTSNTKYTESVDTLFLYRLAVLLTCVYMCS